MNKIPFNKPFTIGRERDYIAAALEAGKLSGNGAFTQRCQAWIEQHTGSRKVLLTPSCTAALEMCALLCDVAHGDEVIMPSFTFVSTANAFVLRGAKPVFVDIRPDTMNLDERLIEAAITPRTKAVVPVHYAGVSCDMDAIMALAGKHGLRVIEDAAQAFDSTYRGKACGAIAPLGCYSFHETKNCICGEGGALLVQDEGLVERAIVTWEKGTNRTKFLHGEVDKYTWVDVGSSYTMSELNAAFLMAQIEQHEQILRQRLRLCDVYRQRLTYLETEGRARLPVVPEDCASNGHIFYLVLRSADDRPAFLDFMNRYGVQSVFHYVPLHSSPMGQHLSAARAVLPVTDDLAARLVRLPLYYTMQDSDVAQVADAVDAWFAR